MKHLLLIQTWGRRVFFGIGWILISLIALNYHQSLIYPQTFIGWVYYLTTYFGHYGLLLAIVYFIIYSPVIRIFPNIVLAKIYSLFLIVLSCLLLLVDSFVFSQYRFHLNGFVIDLLFGGAAQDIFDFPLVIYVFIIGGLVAFTGFVWAYQKKQWTKIQNNFSPNKNWYLYGILICLFVSHGIHIYGSAAGERAVTGLTRLFPFHFPLTANRFLKKHGIISKQTTTLKMNGDLKDFYYPKNALKCSEKTDNKNILFIIVDSWRHDEMNETVTPFISTLRSEATVLNQHFSGSNNTRGGIFSIFYSMPATYWDTALNNQTPPVFMDELRKNEYEFGIFGAASLISPEFDRTVFAKVPNLRITTEGNGSVEKDLTLTKEWKEWLQIHQKTNSEKPFFGFLFYDSPHSYAFPNNFKKDFSPIASSMNYLILNNFTDPVPYLNLHKKSVSFIDTLVKEVVDDLKNKKMDKDTIIVITGDHGQELNDNKKNFWGHNSNYSPTQVKVPMVVLWPGKEPIKVNGITTHYDIVPTIMSELWGCKNPPEEYSYGIDLFKYIKKEWFVVASYGDFGLLDFHKNHILTVNPFGEYSVTDMNLNEIDKKKADEKLLFKVFKDLTRFLRK